MNLLSWLKSKFAAPARPLSSGLARRTDSAQPTIAAGIANDSAAIASADATEQTSEIPADVPATAVVSEERRGKIRTSARQGTRVLIIDDSPTIVSMLRKLLKQNGFETLEAGTAEEGLDIARTLAPDLIFLDIVLPQMDGFAALRHLRRDTQTRPIPVIMISGNEQAVEQFYVQRIGADDFMKKPFSRAEVFARIEPLLDSQGTPRRRAAAATTV